MRATTLVFPALLWATAVHGQDAHQASEAAEAAARGPALVAAMKEASVPLASGLRAAEKVGRPLSAKYELEDGKLQLSVYAAQGAKFVEVIVDHHTGKVLKTEAITGGEDLAQAQAQARAMARSTHALHEVVRKVLGAHPGTTVVAVTPEVEEGQVHADVYLLKGTQTIEVEERL